MSSLWDRIEASGSRADLSVKAGGGVAVAAVVSALESGEPAESLTRSMGITPLDILAALTASALGTSQSPGPSLTQQPPPRPRLAHALSEREVAGLLPHASRKEVLAVSAGLLQVHDFWESSHVAAQEADDLGESRFSAYWHGIAHRREPDAGNAAYWFRRVGQHPVFPTLAELATPILDDHRDSRLSSRFLGQGRWNSQAMIDLCTAARPDTREESLARRLQRLEMQILMDATVAAVVTHRGD